MMTEQTKNEVECGMCGEAFGEHRTASGNSAPFCMAPGSRPGDTFVRGAVKATVELTPSLMSMAVLAYTDDAVYLILPLALQRETGGCSCEHCKKNPELAKWDTLAVPTKPNFRGGYNEWHTWTCHMPDGAVAGFQAWAEKKRKEVKS